MSEKKTGRPAGSKNRSADQFVSEIPPTCQKCGCAKFLALKGSGVIRREYAGTINGQAFSRYEKRRKQCFTCGQIIVVTRYLAEGIITDQQSADAAAEK